MDKRLKELRAMIKGWAFLPNDRLKGRLERADTFIKTLPSQLQVQAEEIVRGLREAVRRLR